MSQDIEKALEAARREGADNCLKDVIAWLRNNPHWAKATLEWAAEMLATGQWKVPKK